ncbi:hypothetical protein 2018MatB_1050 [Vibrio phage ICP1]|nr:hypothetical protein 2018MatB_1050 [Vibrio phage ICP1]
MILKRGSSGADVKNMQEYLTALGYDTKGVEGTFEGGTESAVKAFQKDMSFTVVDGIIGNQTAKHLVDMYYGKVVPFGYVTNTPWVSEAIEDYFVSEIKGEKHNPRVVQYFKDAHSKIILYLRLKERNTTLVSFNTLRMHTVLGLPTMKHHGAPLQLVLGWNVQVSVQYVQLVPVTILTSALNC